MHTGHTLDTEEHTLTLHWLYFCLSALQCDCISIKSERAPSRKEWISIMRFDAQAGCEKCVSSSHRNRSCRTLGLNTQQPTESFNCFWSDRCQFKQANKCRNGRQNQVSHLGSKNSTHNNPDTSVCVIFWSKENTRVKKKLLFKTAKLLLVRAGRIKVMSCKLSRISGFYTNIIPFF